MVPYLVALAAIAIAITSRTPACFSRCRRASARSLEVLGHATELALRSVKARSLPMGKVGGRFVRTLQEGQERSVRIGAGANRGVRQQEFSKLSVERRGLRRNLGKVEAVRHRISVAVEGGMIDTGPEARA